MKFINLTPHKVTIVDEIGNFLIDIFPEKKTCRVKEEKGSTIKIGNIPITDIRYNGVENLPEPCEDTIFVVSALVLQQCPDRKDLVAPDSGLTADRNRNGQVKSARGFLRLRGD